MLTLLLLLSAPAAANDGPNALFCDESTYFDSAFDGGDEDDDCTSYVSACQQPANSPHDDTFLSFTAPDDVWVEMNSTMGIGVNVNLYMLQGNNPGFGGQCTNEIICIDWEWDNGTGNGVYADNWGGSKSIYGGIPQGLTVWYGWEINETAGGDTSLTVDLSCCYDLDGDGTYDPGTEGLCPLLEQFPDQVDCDDADPNNYPGNAETCDGADNDCDNSADEALPLQTYYQDADGDTYGNAAVTVSDCAAPSGYVARAGDCDDTTAARSPGNSEITCDGIDNDCNAATLDEPDFDGDGSSACDDCDDANGNRSPDFSEVSCNGIDDDCNAATIDTPDTDADGVDDCSDCDPNDGNNYPGNTEICDGFDNDCDDLIDDLDPDVDDSTGATYYADADSDTYGDPNNTIESCGVPTGYTTDRTDCDDNYAERNPGETEVCDGLDNDCDVTVDEETECYDDDGDGFTELSGDCDDASTSLDPTEPETCDGVDNDCDGAVDEGTGCTDDDEDGYCEGVDIDGDGQADDCRDGSTAGDCSDGDANVNPGTTELAGNGVDDDCDGAVDGDAFDADEDGYLAEGGDCGPNDASTYPGATELADGVDNDCDGTTDEGTANTDDDGDGVAEVDGDCNDADGTILEGVNDVAGNGIDDDCDGVVDEGGNTTDDDGDGLSEEQGDCNDADADIHPGADEALDGADNDCDGEADEGLVDADGDGYAASEGDCNDADGWMHPGLAEQCDGQDNDCDDLIDEGTCGNAGVAPPVESGCNCASTGSPAALWLALPLLGLFRRRARG